MKVKIIALILATLTVFSLASCGKIHYHTGNGGTETPPAEDEKYPSAENEPITETDPPIETPVYVYSVTSKVVHREGCYHIDRMNEDYKKTFEGDIVELIEKEYELCKTCFPPEKEEDEDTETPPEDENKISKEDATFVINAKSLKLHTLDCYHVEVMNEENIEYTDLTLEELIALDSYIPCGTCLPDEAEKYKEEHGITDDSK